MAITMKLIKGIVNERVVAEMSMMVMPESMMRAWSGGKTDPPRMAMISPAPAILMFSPIPCRAKP